MSKISRNFRRALTAGPLILIAAPGFAQFSGGGVAIIGGPSFGHELMLIVIGAVLGGFLGPLFQILDGWLGITPGIRQQKANYAVQREIAAHLETLVKMASQNATETQTPARDDRPDAAHQRWLVCEQAKTLDER